MTFYLIGQCLSISFITQPVEQISLEGFNASFACAAITSPVKAVTYLWKLDGNFINTNQKIRFRIAADGRLSIRDIQSVDFGVYQCIAQCADGAIISQPAQLVKACKFSTENVYVYQICRRRKPLALKLLLDQG